MAWALIGSGHSSVADGDPGQTPTSHNCQCTGADLVVAFIGYYPGPGAPYPTLTDGVAGATGWVQAVTSDGQNGGRSCRAYYKFNPSQSNLSIITTQNNPQNYVSTVSLSFSGSSGVFGAKVPASDGALGTVSGKDSTIATGSGVTTTEADMLLVAGSGSDVEGPTITVFDGGGGSTWVNTSTNVPTQAVGATSGNHVGCFGAYRVAASAAQYGVQFHEEPNFKGTQAGMVILSFKMLSTGGGATLKGLPLTGVGQ